jgi:hypothetical protein
MSKFTYRLSLQANVYAGKLYHLMLLLPNLTTGADFGVTSFISGLVRMIQLGEVTSSKRRLLRGMDGGPENRNFVSLGMNSTLVHELHEGSINEVQQHRLPPGSLYFTSVLRVAALPCCVARCRVVSCARCRVVSRARCRVVSRVRAAVSCRVRAARVVSCRVCAAVSCRVCALPCRVACALPCRVACAR